MTKKKATKDEIILSHYGEILRQLVIEKGGDDKLLLANSRVDAAALTDDRSGLSYEQFMSLVRNALTITEEPALGLLYGQRLTPMTHGSLGQAALSAANIREALQIISKYYRTRLAPVSFIFFEDEEADDAVIQLDVNINIGDLTPFLIETLFVSIMEINRFLFGAKLLVDGRCFISYPAPEYWELYRKYFSTNIEFDRGLNQLRFKRRHLELPMVLANPVARQLAEKQCEQELKVVETRSSLVGDVRRLLEEHEGSVLSMEEIAERLHMTSRTLRRQLQTFNTSYQDIVAEFRKSRALELLRHSRKPIDEIAFELGYSDPSNFGRAFRKWTGKSPSEYRRV